LLARIPDAAIEPRDRTLVGRNLVRSGNDLEEGVLQDVLCERAVINAAFKKTKEGLAVPQEYIERRFFGRSVR